MRNKFKWAIPGLKKDISLNSAAKYSLEIRIAVLLESIKSYFNSSTEEHLHQVRISLRRIRYNLELFYSCFDKKLFLRFYNRITKLQDLTGKVRDIDVMKAKLDSTKDISSTHTEDLINALEAERIKNIEQLKMILFKFTLCKTLKDFRTELK